MDIVEKRTHYLERVSKSWNVPLNSLSDYLIDKKKFKKIGPRGMLIKEKNV
jgi:hypothetical protein